MLSRHSATFVRRAITCGWIVAFAIPPGIQALSAQAAGGSASTTRDWSTVERALGRTGTANPGGVLKFGFPRSDLQVMVAGVAVKPALALGSWLAFKRIGGGRSAVMGDLVLTEPEIGPVMQALQQRGVDPTALHNHLLHETPHVMYMHVHARGDETAIAQALHDALALTGTPLGAPAAPAPAAALDLDTATIARTLGFGGKVNGGVYQITVPRAETIRDAGMEVPPAMGVATAINIQPTGSGQAAVTGDFVLRPNEVAAVMRTLRDNGIEVTAVHSHLVHEEPHLLFMHFWATADAATLARGLRAALDKTAVKH